VIGRRRGIVPELLLLLLLVPLFVLLLRRRPRRANEVSGGRSCVQGRQVRARGAWEASGRDSLEIGLLGWQSTASWSWWRVTTRSIGRPPLRGAARGAAREWRKRARAGG